MKVNSPIALLTQGYVCIIYLCKLRGCSTLSSAAKAVRFPCPSDGYPNGGKKMLFFFIIQLSKQLDLRLTRRRCLDPLIPPNITQFMFEKLFQAKIMHYLDLWGGADFVGSGGDGWKQEKNRFFPSFSSNIVSMGVSCQNTDRKWFNDLSSSGLAVGWWACT